MTGEGVLLLLLLFMVGRSKFTNIGYLLINEVGLAWRTNSNKEKRGVLRAFLIYPEAIVCYFFDILDHRRCHRFISLIILWQGESGRTYVGYQME